MNLKFKKNLKSNPIYNTLIAATNFPRKVILLFRAIGINPVKTCTSLLLLPGYFIDLCLFWNPRKSWQLSFHPVLLDKFKSSGSLGEYFYQDLFVAQQILNQNPSNHVDVGSRVDGFIAHLACFRPVTVLDIREQPAKINNINFIQWDMTNPNTLLDGQADCVSCLHTIEHVGLGRYGDKIDFDGWKKAFQSLINLIAPNGSLWLSVPIGLQRVYFNAHRVFDPQTIFDFGIENGLYLNNFFYLTDSGIEQSINIQQDFKQLGCKQYGLGIFLFSKPL